MGACGSKDPKTSGGGESTKRYDTANQSANGDSAEKHPDFGLKETHDLKKFLGRGGTGDTYLFTDKRNSQPVAIKLIKRPIPKVILPNILREIRVQSLSAPSESPRSSSTCVADVSIGVRSKSSQLAKPLQLFHGVCFMQIQAELGEGHVNVIEAKEVLVTHTHLALSLEYAAGGSLTSYVADRWQHSQHSGLFLSEDEARYFFRVSAKQQAVAGKPAYHQCPLLIFDLATCILVTFLLPAAIYWGRGVLP